MVDAVPGILSYLTGTDMDIRSFEDNVIKYMDRYDMLPSDSGDDRSEKSVVIGVSGGADSVALLRFLTALREKRDIRIRVVHVNHMIRGDEALRDQQFVEKLCQDLDVECFIYQEDIPAMAEREHLTEEEAGRIYRYRCFNEQAEKMAEPVKIAVAHNQDDLAETVLYNVIRGSSLEGLTGIKPVRGRIIRPFLDTSREEIEEYLEGLNQEYVTDSTNLTVDYSRNRIRNIVMPELVSINSNAIGHIVSLSQDALTLTEDTKEKVRATREKAVKKNSQSYDISIDALSALTHFETGELILSVMESVCGRRKDITREHINSVAGLARRDTGKEVSLPYEMYAERIYGKIRIGKVSGRLKGEIEGEPGGHLEIDTFPYKGDMEISKKEYTKMIDYDKIHLVPVLRTPQKDDYIVINSDGGRKKLYRYLSSSKIERDLRDLVPVVADGDEIIWIVGHRLSERYKIDENTKTVCIITYHKD